MSANKIDGGVNGRSDRFVEDALLVPYKARGRDRDGWDCWGLVVRYYADVLCVDLPHYDGRGYAADDELTEHYRRELADGWLITHPPKMGCLAIFRVAGRPVHCGVMLDDRRFLHADERVGTQVQRIDHLPWNQRLEGVFRRAA